MIKKFLNVVLSILAVLFLSIGILYTNCPVVPFVKYESYKDEQFEENNGMQSYNYYIFNLNGTYKSYFVTIVYQGEKIFLEECILDDMGLFEKDKNESNKETLYLFGNTIDKFKFLKNKCEFQKGNSTCYKATFNPTFIFYIVSGVSFVLLFCINYKEILKKFKTK